MPRPTLVTRPRKLTISLPGELATRLDLYLASPSQGRIPYGAHQEFFVERITEFFAKLERSTFGAIDVKEEGATLCAVCLRATCICEGK